MDAAFAAMDDVDHRMSLWHESELTRLNEAGEGRLSAPLWTVISEALAVARTSGGAFDPTVEPWTSPLPATLSRPKACIGYTAIRQDAAHRRISLQGRRIDLGGIAKGYACDQAVTAIMRAGATGAVVNLGQSSIKAEGNQSARVLIRDPEQPDAPVWGEWLLKDMSLSTSGGDQKPGHIMDPHAGKPIHARVSMAVVMKSAMRADALSTAIYVLGAGPGLLLLAREGADGYVLQRAQGKKQIITTQGFSRKYRLRLPADVQLIESPQAAAMN